MKEIRKEDILVLPRKKDSHKGSYGRLLIIAGSEKYPGAAALSTEAALRSGAGLVTLMAKDSVINKIFSRIPEAVLAPRERFDRYLLEKELMKSTAVVIGCGSGKGILKTVKYTLKNYKGPIVLDADGINAIAGKTHLLKKAAGTLILTPHPGEMARISGKEISEIQHSREETARRFAEEHGVYLVLKGNGTVIAAPSGECFINTTGNAGMARGGSGDVLSGMLGAFLSAGEDDVLTAIKKGVYLHGLAGDKAAEEKTEHSMLPRDIINSIPTAFKGITELI